MKNQEVESNLVERFTSGDTFNMVMVNTAILVSLALLNALIKKLLQITGPVNYKLDMTTKEYCKTLAEVNNDLDFPSRAERYPDKSNEHSDDQSNQPRHLSTNSVNEVRLVNGWIPVMESFKLLPGKVKKAIIFGKDLIVTRSDDGKQVNVLEAYCPHLGAHLAIGGLITRINNETCIECPFHGWRFRTLDGQCVDIPYQQAKGSNNCIPKQAKLAHWPCTEVDNFIYMWHHSDGLPPSWHFVPTPQIQDGSWTMVGRSYHKSNLEISDVLENGADMNHFAGVHGDLVFFGNIDKLAPFKFISKYIRHTYEPEWKPVLDKAGRQTHIAQLTVKSWLSVFGFNMIQFSALATQTGPGTVKIRYTSKFFGDGILVMNSIPVCGRRIKYLQHVYTSSSIYDRIMARMVLIGESKMLERDMTIWNHKKHLRNPVLLPDDKTIRKFRMWYSQFLRRKVKIQATPTPKSLDQHEGRPKNDDNNLSKIDF